MDGYIRLTFDSFLRFKMMHLFSGMDQDRPPVESLGARLSSITGYTEWVSDSVPVITIGWDWEMTGKEGVARLRPAGIPGSNLMFVCQNGLDLGTEKSGQLLTAWLEIFAWQTATLNTITQQSSPVNFDSC